jgi:hypothetical protein
MKDLRYLRYTLIHETWHMSIKISFKMRYKSNMLNDTTWKLKTSECSSIITFENLSRTISLCGFQNIWSFLILVTMSIHSWILFILIACWLAISEETPLESSISFSCIKFLEYPFLNSSRRIKSKDVWIGRTLWYQVFFSQGDMIICGSCQYISYFSQFLKFSLNFGLSGFGHRICPASSLDLVSFSGLVR